MSESLRKLDIIALTASGTAATKLYDFLQALREDVASGIAGDTIYHKTVLAGSQEKNAAASNLATSLTLVNSLKTLINTHLASTGLEGAHAAASAATITAAAATDLSSAQTLANEIKADFNTHLTESGVHLKNDATYTITSSDATDQSSLNTLLNEIKADYNAHRAVSMSSMPVTAQN